MFLETSHKNIVSYFLVRFLGYVLKIKKKTKQKKNMINIKIKTIYVPF